MQELTFEEFAEINEEELTCIFAETGADREMDFDREAEEERIFNSNEYSILIRTKDEKYN